MHFLDLEVKPDIPVVQKLQPVELSFCSFYIIGIAKGIDSRTPLSHALRFITHMEQLKCGANTLS